MVTLRRLSAIALVACACSGQVVVDQNAATGGGGGVAGVTSAATGGQAAVASAVSSGGAIDPGAASTSTSTGASAGYVTCQGHIYQCGDGVDNDGDGLIDADDPDCMGPCDNSEFNVGSAWIGGEPGPTCVIECAFDGDSGNGNDGCIWNHACDPHEVAPNYYPDAWLGSMCAYDPNATTFGTPATCSELYGTQSPQCLGFCGPLTPNGCDCFGCCELPAATGNYVYIDSIQPGSVALSCTFDSISDPTKCQPCTPVPSCLNTCDHCELCVGKPTLPADCSGPQCPAGVEACGQPGLPSCPEGTYCITGCCIPTPN